MKRAILILVLVLAAASTLFLVRLQGKGPAGEVLVLSGGTMRAIMEDAAARYRARSSDVITVTYGDSAELCAQIINTGKGDLFLCHDPFMPWAASKGRIGDWKTLAYLDNVIVVAKGNPLAIRGLEDLARPGLRLGIGDRRYSTSGVIVKQLLQNAPFGTAVSSNILDEARGHQERCTAVALGSLDATITWKPVALANRGKLDLVPLPEAEKVDAVTSATYGKSDLANVGLTIGLIKREQENPAARRFYEFLVNDCGDLYAQRGFRLEKR